jgi:nitroreductase
METEPDTPEGKSLRSANYLANHMGEAPVLIFCCVKRYHDERRTGQPMVGSIYPAVQNLCLAARAYGLGTSITAMHAMSGTMSGKEIDELIGVPPTYANEVLVPMGYPKGRWARPARKPAADVIFFERWGARR